MTEWVKRSDGISKENGLYEWTSKYYLVTDGEEIGIGLYDFDEKCWIYRMVGKIEMDDNRITHYAELPNLPKKDLEGAKK